MSISIPLELPVIDAEESLIFASLLIRGEWELNFGKGFSFMLCFSKYLLF